MHSVETGLSSASMRLLCLLKGWSHDEGLCQILGEKGVQHASEGSLTVLQIATLPSEIANLKVNPQTGMGIERKKTWQETWQKT